MTALGEPELLPSLDTALARARRRYPWLAEDESVRIVRRAAREVAHRGLGDHRRRTIALHVAVASGAAEVLAGIDHASLLPVELPTDPDRPSAGPIETALAEHLHAQLTGEEQLVATLRGTLALPGRTAADAIGLTAEELAGLEAGVRAEATTLVLPHHHDLICEPAELAGAAGTGAGQAAVRTHLARCRVCRREFDARVATIVAQAGRLSFPLPLLAARRSLRSRLRAWPRRG